MASFRFAVPVNSTALHVDWRAPEKANGVITGYELVVYRPRSKRSFPFSFRMNATQTEAIMGNLNENSKYTVQLRAATAVGYGTSIVANITTLVEGRPIIY